MRGRLSRGGVSRRRRRWPASRVAGYAALVTLSALFVAPLGWMIATSFKTDAEAVAAHPTLLPRTATTTGYQSILHASNAPVLRWFLNSVLAAAGYSVLVVATSALAAYA